MARRGGFSHTYDAASMIRFKSDAEAVGQVAHEISDRILGTVEATIAELAATIAAEHGIHEDVARLLVAQRASEAVDFLRWVKAGEARAAGMPVRALMDAMDYSSPTSISRMIPELDHVSALRARVDATGTPATVDDDRGFTITLTPRDGASQTVEQARKLGLLPEDLGTTT